MPVATLTARAYRLVDVHAATPRWHPRIRVQGIDFHAMCVCSHSYGRDWPGSVEYFCPVATGGLPFETHVARTDDWLLGFAGGRHRKGGYRHFGRVYHPFITLTNPSNRHDPNNPVKRGVIFPRSPIVSRKRRVPCGPMGVFWVGWRGLELGNSIALIPNHPFHNPNQPLEP